MSLKVAILFLAACSALADFVPSSEEQIEDAWNEFTTTYNKQYNDPNESSMRHGKFVNNMKIVIKHNKEYDQGVQSFKMGVNQFSDMSSEDMKKTYFGYNYVAGRPQDPSNLFDASAYGKAPASVDWTKKGAVTPVKDQGKCGSCWAFSTTGSLEGQYFIKTGKLVSLSEQNLIDCSVPEGNNGCHGGLMDNAFKYIIKNKGIDTEASYPYEAKDDTCRFKSSNIGATVKKFVDIKSGSEDDLKKAAAIVPVSVAIDASHINFQNYKTGIYYNPDCSSDNLDHGVLVVGYGTEKGKDYWLVKNSWGPKWGENGYIKMARNRNNNCGIASEASFPIV